MKQTGDLEAVGNASIAGPGCALSNGCCACGASRTTLDSGIVNSEDCICRRVLR